MASRHVTWTRPRGRASCTRTSRRTTSHAWPSIWRRCHSGRRVNSSGTPGRGAVSVGALVDGYDCVLFDIDGVVRVGSQPIAGAGETVAAVRDRGIATAFVTNNASSTPAEMAGKLEAVGVAATPSDIVTSALVAAEMLDPGVRCLVIGMTGIHEALTQRGCAVVTDPQDADAVVVAFDRGLVWDDLRRATLALHNGARFLATNDDATFPSPEGLWPGNGSVVAALERSSGRTAEVAGKPHAPLLLAAAQRCNGGRVLFVGDRHETDIVGAAALGWDSALVLSGVTRPVDIPSLDPQPTFVLDSVVGLLRPSPA
ncbi:MAG: HAD-IIA family hydrolase [Nitriliruptorales bacterium]|nr:HAD-IIA family hydrolase [Nitriliruptorales bacterium]